MPIYEDQELVVGDTAIFGLAVKKNDLTWDISGATVELYLRDPSGNWSTAYSATVTSGADGEAQYSAATTVLDEAGTWFRQWKVSVSGIVKYSDGQEFEVLPAPG